MRDAGAGNGERELIEFLSAKRWFGQKGREIRHATLRDVIPVRWPGLKKKYAVARAEVQMDGGAATYQLFLVQDAPAIADALDEAEFRRFLADAFLTGVKLERDRGGTRWIVESESQKALVVPPKAPIDLASSEQSNSSVIMNREAILKLYRRIEPGIHPDVEVTRFLTIERMFLHVPVILGTIRFEDSNGTAVAGMLQEYVQGAVDGWTHALDRAREYVGATDSQEPAGGSFAEEAEQLGAVTRAMHDTLASGEPGTEFDLRPATPADVSAWGRGVEQTIESACTALERALGEERLPKDLTRDAKAVWERRPRFIQGARELADGVTGDAGSKTRTHGDFHLGQVLRSAAAQFLVIDFEGEPARPLHERRARHSPLRDVAGMLRSFAYAAAAGATGATNPLAAVRGSRWEKGARDSFLRGYFTEKNGRPSLLPRSQSNAGRLIALFETEKLFYELQYELGHRPEWVGIPLRDIAKLHA